MKCNKDCFHCQLPDCENDSVYPENSLYKNRPKEQQEYQKSYAKRRRDEARAKGNCIICLKKPATKGAKCYDCYIRQKRYDKAKYNNERETWKDQGLCYFCGSACIEGKKVCKKHYDILCKNIGICNKSENTKKAQKRFCEWYWNMRKVGKNE